MRRSTAFGPALTRLREATGLGSFGVGMVSSAMHRPLILLTALLTACVPTALAQGGAPLPPGFVPLVPARTALPYYLPSGFQFVDYRTVPSGQPAGLLPERRSALVLETAVGRLVVQLDTVKQPRMSAIVAGAVLDRRLDGATFDAVEARGTARLNRLLALPPAAAQAARIPTPPDAPGVLVAQPDEDGVRLLFTLGPSATLADGALAFGRVIEGAAVLSALTPDTSVSRAYLIVSAAP